MSETDGETFKMAAALVAIKDEFKRISRTLNHSWMYVRHFGDKMKSLNFKQTLQRKQTFLQKVPRLRGKFLRCLLLCPFTCFQILAAKLKAKAPSAKKTLSNVGAKMLPSAADTLQRRAPSLLRFPSQ